MRPPRASTSAIQVRAQIHSLAVSLADDLAAGSRYSSNRISFRLGNRILFIDLARNEGENLSSGTATSERVKRSQVQPATAGRLWERGSGEAQLRKHERS